MSCLVCTDLHFIQAGDRFFCRPVPSDFFQRYREVWGAVSILSRLRYDAQPPPGVPALDFTGIRMLGLPDFRGPVQYARHRRHIRTVARDSLSQVDSIVLRVPSMIGMVASALLRSQRRPYGVEVCGNPQEAMARGSVRHPLRPFFCWYYTRMLRRQCQESYATAYVTATALQTIFPPHPGRFSTNFSDVRVSQDQLLNQPRQLFPQGPRLRIVMVGSFEQMYKGHDVLLHALAQIPVGIDYEVSFIGEGKHRPEMQRLAEMLGLAERMTFRGELPAGDAVQAELDRADLFVMPSRTEGLPRAMIEAMARGLPCIGSCVGGIPELLAPEDMVPPNDSMALADKLAQVLSYPVRMRTMSQRNLARAAHYIEDVLHARRLAFYRHLREGTEAWLRGRTPD